MRKDKDTGAGGMGPHVQHTDDAQQSEQVQVAPPFPVPLPGRAGYPLLPSCTARAEIVHARERAQKPHLAAKGEAKTGNPQSAPDGEITPATSHRYLHRCTILMTRDRRECGIREDVPRGGEGVFSIRDAHAFAIWLLSLKPDLSAATWRFYRGVAYHVISSMPHDGVDAALALLDNDRARHESRAGTDGRGKRGRTLPRRATGFDLDDFNLIQHAILYQAVRSDTPQILRDWMTARVSVGLRPLE